MSKTRSSETENVQQTGFGNMLSSLSSSRSNDKYGGLITRPWYKDLTHDLLQLFSYIYTVAPKFYVIHDIITYLRITQFFLISLNPASSIWPNGSIQKTTVGVISIFCSWVPATAWEYAVHPYLIFYICEKILMLILILYSSRYYRIEAKLPDFIPVIINFYVATFGHILHPPAIEAAARLIVKMAVQGDKTDLIMNVILIVLMVIVSIAYGWLFFMVISRGLMFRPNSLMTVTVVPQNFAFMATIVLQIMVGLAVYSHRYACAGLNFANSIIYGSCIAICYIQGGFVYNTQKVIYIASCMTGMLMSALVAVYQILERSCALYEIWGFFLVFILCIIIAINISKHDELKYLTMLDEVEDNEDTSFFKTPNQLLNASLVGFLAGHQACISWQVFKLGINQWERNTALWYSYAKFIAIYPEENNQLAWIYRNVKQLSLKGAMAGCIKMQSIAIARQREQNLSAELKVKLNKLSKHVTSTKHKLRHVWEVVIQGNIKDVEISSKSALKSLAQDTADFKHILGQFPNNRFVMRAYRRFLHDISFEKELCSQVSEKTHLLQKGIMVTADQAHEYAMKIFKYIPNVISNQSLVMNGTDVDDILMDSEAEGSEEYNEQSQVLKSKIEEVHVPAVRSGIIIRVCIIVILFLIPLIAMIVYTHSLVGQMNNTLYVMQTISTIRYYNSITPAFSIHYLYEIMGVMSEPDFSKIETTVSLGGAKTTRDQLRYILKRFSTIISELELYRDAFDLSSKASQRAYELIFGYSVNYSFYVSPTEVQYAQKTIGQASMDYVVQLDKIMSDESIDAQKAQSLLSTSAVLNPMMGRLAIADIVNEALDAIIEVIKDQHSTTGKICNFAMIVIVVVVAVVYLVTTWYEISSIMENKRSVYMCLTSLPKNTVSQVCENLRTLSKNMTTDSHDDNSTGTRDEMNKQDDAVLKVFASGANTSGGLGEMAVAVILAIISLGLQISMTVVLAMIPSNETQELMISAPHLNYFLGAYSERASSVLSISGLLVEQTQYKLPVQNADYWIDSYEASMKQSKVYYDRARFGTDNSQDWPFKAFEKGIEDSASKVECKDKLKIPTNYAEAMECYDADNAFLATESLVASPLQKYRDDNNYDLKADGFHDNLWILMIYPLLETFFKPTYDMIIPTIISTLSSQSSSFDIVASVLAVVAILFELLHIYRVCQVEEHCHCVLKLLLHCPTDVVMQTPKIQSVLCGAFVSKHKDKNRGHEFFDEIIENMPDAVIITDINGIVKTKNIAVDRLFPEFADKLIDQSVTVLLQSGVFEGDMSSLIDQNNKGDKVCEVVYHKEVNDYVSLQIKSMLITNLFVLSFRDNTQAAKYNALIKEERLKSDQMLQSILPASLVKRVQDGEQNISFSVQTATILFLDIVSFTPWCAANTGQFVMSTLNNLFKKLDACVAKYPTMTKIKCIGDCYMAAGGIFAEVNQPTEHAREVTMFGLDAIDCVKELNKELGTSLQIRVGINSGGPLVAGVLGVGKPTFEILGPVINMAQQMEHHGVPMHVHVSRAVYELIYGDTFIIKERGTIEVKQGSVVTYLVSRMK